MSPFSLYVHVPYCRAICPYCDFNVHRVSPLPEARYVDALTSELRTYASRPPFAGRQLASIYFGGGTPSLFHAESIGRVVEEADSAFGIAPDAEVTLEANPEDLAVEPLRALRARGVNRLSIGIQSFEPRHLRRLGRGHTASETKTAVAVARAAGFGNVSVDLMFGIPDETLEECRHDVDTAIALAPDHVSAYGLTYEERTPFFALRNDGRLQPVEEEVERAMFLEVRGRLAAAGYAAYEVSNFARPGFESRHNRNYWSGGDYLGLGAGAHSHAAAPDAAERWWNRRAPDAYVDEALAQGAAREGGETLDRRASESEFVMLGLRTAGGIDAARFRERFGRELAAALPGLARALHAGLVEADERSVRLTPRGLLVADSVAAELL